MGLKARHLSAFSHSGQTVIRNQLPAATFKGSHESIRMGAKQRFAEKHPQIVRKSLFPFIVRSGYVEITRLVSL